MKLNQDQRHLLQLAAWVAVAARSVCCLAYAPIPATVSSRARITPANTDEVLGRPIIGYLLFLPLSIEPDRQDAGRSQTELTRAHHRHQADVGERHTGERELDQQGQVARRHETQRRALAPPAVSHGCDHRRFLRTFRGTTP